MLGHIPLPAKITVEVLPPIHLREEFGAGPRRRRGLRPRHAPDAGDPRRAGRRAALPGDRMRVAAPDRHLGARPSRSGSSSPTPRATCTSCPASRAGRSPASSPTGLGARYRMLMRVGSAEVGGAGRGRRVGRAPRHGLEQRHRGRPARPLAPARARPRPHPRRVPPLLRRGRRRHPRLALRAARGPAPSQGNIRRSLQQLKRAVEHEQLRRAAAERRSARASA